MTYTLSIEDRVGTGVNCTERAVIVNGGSLVTERTYNPNAKSEGFNHYDNTTFDTPFSIVHPFRDLAKLIAGESFRDLAKLIEGEYVEGPFPNLKYDISSVNGAQRTLFENIFSDVVKKAWERQPIKDVINFPPPLVYSGDAEYSLLGGHDEKF